MRKIIAIILALLALLFWYMTLTVPMVSAAAPALIAIALTIFAWYLWKERGKNIEV